MDCNIDRLKGNLSADDASIFGALEAQGYAVELEDEKYVIRNREAREIIGPFDSDDETISAARTLHEQSRQAERLTQEQVIEGLVSKPKAEHFKAHEVDLKTKLSDWLRSEGVPFKHDVECPSGTADLCTEDAVYEFQCG